MTDEPIFPHDIAEMDAAFARVTLSRVFLTTETGPQMDLRANDGADESQGTNK